jgi:hypothetical protein
MWPRIAAALLGGWLMAAPAVLGNDRLAADNAHVVGPLIVSVSVVALSAVTRPVRWGLLPLGIWLVAAPWLLGLGWPAALHDAAVGLAIAALGAIRGGRVEEAFGGGWSALWRDDSERRRANG